MAHGNGAGTTLRKLAATFGTAFVTGFTGAVAPGPLLAVCIHQTLSRGFAAGMTAVAGHAAAGSYGRESPVVATLGSIAAVVVHALSWIFTAALRGADALANLVGHSSEFEADRRAVRMGFGRELASALRAILAHGTGQRPIGWRARLAASHPPARTRVARIEALMRHPAR